jgi:hypothetical protein
MLMKAAALAAGALVFATAASAQENGPPPQQQGQQAQQAPPPQRPPRRAPEPYSPHPAVTASFEGRSGSFSGVIDKDKGEMCYLLNAAGIAGASAAKIVSDKGAVAVNLQPPVGGASGTCAPIAADTARALLDHPGNYWLQIDSATYPQATMAPLHAQTYG